MSGIARRTRCGAAVAVVVSVLAAMPMTARAEPAAADIQWAQIFLKEKGFDIGGRANGQMTAQTRAALGAYQKSVGLPATGQLDSATTARIMGEREKKASPTMGSLSRSQVGQTPRDREVAPRAAPTARIDSGNESVGGMAQFGSAPSASASGSPAGHAPARTASAPSAPAAPAHSSPAAAPAVPSPPRAAAHGSDGPAPQAAPRGAVTAATPAGDPAPLVEASTAGGAPGWMTNGLRYGVMGLVAATLGGIGFAWWRSGRGAVPAGVPGDGAPRDTRVEPSFGSPRRREELTPGPRLTAGARRR
ncbi:hypothetical protein J2847_002763 [Azospirillum agricola]|uniref:peptidoglycan-binding domain-containing protein n=1 Tax=Azospirillum agricola TaxID=1720247 RepID=UPI001AE187FE|nr:peptidoglycan-binding domain-containing protein [Azospirillum agricola]MBP2229464.1 hypothetical protein [Azospirillum agricola]